MLPKNKGAGTIVAILTVCGALVIIAGAVLVLVRNRSVVSYPDTWDRRVDFAVSFIEKEKGKPFDHPVSIDFLPEKEFVDEITAPAASPTDQDRTDARREAALLRSLGLVQGDVDLLQQQSDLESSGTAAYYDPKTKHVKVRGTDLSSFAVRGTILHELTHAWQDQHFDLQRLRQMKTRDQQTAFRSVVEGDAVNMENAWVDQLPAGDRTTYDEQTKQQSDTATQQSKNVPAVLIADFGAPYELGPLFMEGMRGWGGNPQSERALREPPVSEGQIMQPWVYVSGGGGPDELPAPDTGGSTAVETNSLGALTVYLLLAEHIDPHQALAASDAWHGDAYALTEDNGTVCVTARVASVDAAGADRLAAAFAAWAGDIPGATVTEAGAGIDVKSCDPGTTADLKVTGRALSTINFPVARVAGWAGVLDAGGTPERARCVGDAVVAHLALADVDQSRPSTGGIAQARDAAQAACP